MRTFATSNKSDSEEAPQVKPKRKRRTKAEMEEARALKNSKASVGETEQADAKKTRKRRTKKETPE